MRIVRRLSELERGGPVVATIGKFDGLHLGHRHLIELTKRRAADLGAQSAVITFDPHPLVVLRPDQPFSQLLCFSDRVALLGTLGLDLLLIITFSPAVARQTPAEFMQGLVDHLDLRLLVEGTDFALGKARAGNPAVLAELGQRLGYAVETIPRLRVDYEPVSSNAIRGHLGAGDVARAGALLGRPPSASGPVVAGSRRGRTIGFPTANIAVPRDLTLPSNGVYAAMASCPELPHPFPAMVNIGTRPTFDDGARAVEAHLLDFDGDLYGTLLTVHFIARLRDERRFDGPAGLIAQLERDRSATVERLAGLAGGGTSP